MFCLDSPVALVGKVVAIIIVFSRSLSCEKLSSTLPSPINSTPKVWARHVCHHGILEPNVKCDCSFDYPIFVLLICNQTWLTKWKVHAVSKLVQPARQGARHIHYPNAIFEPVLPCSMIVASVAFWQSCYLSVHFPGWASPSLVTEISSVLITSHLWTCLCMWPLKMIMLLNSALFARLRWATVEIHSTTQEAVMLGLSGLRVGWSIL